MNKFYILVMLIFCLSFSINAQIPRTLSYQGILTDNAGSPRPDKEYQFTFCLYDTAIGGTPLWSEQKTLAVKGGLFSTILGDQKPFGATVKFDKQYWLGIQIGSEAELSPRIQLTSVGYSMNAVRADTANFIFGSNTWAQNDSTLYYIYGNVGIGTNCPQHKLQIDASEDVGLRLHNRTNENNSNTPYLLFSGGYSPYNGVALRGKSDMLYGRKALVFYAGWDGNTDMPGLAGLKERMRISSNGNVGIGTLNPRSLLEVAGRTKTQILEITGGSDLAEPFEFSHTDSLPVGSLVVIDPENPGKLKQATEPYDKRVAGVISGAGGINPGLTLTQQGKLEGSQHVALTGKVYALATTTNGTIEPGDLLTTSDVPGHAMKATDKDLWPGAVIGKAMSSLKEGQGLVLVLIQPH